LQQLLDAQKLDKEEVLKQLKQLELQQAAKEDMMSKLMQLVVTQQLKPTSSSLKSEQYRTPAMAAYNVAREVNGVQQVLCMVSDRYFLDSEVTAGHMLRVDWAPMAVGTHMRALHLLQELRSTSCVAYFVGCLLPLPSFLC
jgi:hypothetical protein